MVVGYSVSRVNLWKSSRLFFSTQWAPIHHHLFHVSNDHLVVFELNMLSQLIHTSTILDQFCCLFRVQFDLLDLFLRYLQRDDVELLGRPRKFNQVLLLSILMNLLVNDLSVWIDRIISFARNSFHRGSCSSV